MSRQRQQRRHQQSYRYETIGTAVVIPAGFVRAAATVASIVALEEYWRAERLLAQPRPDVLPLHVHQRVIAASHHAKQWATVAEKVAHGRR